MRMDFRTARAMAELGDPNRNSTASERTMLSQVTDHPDTIYYLRTIQAYINDITLPGPFDTAHAIADHIRGRLERAGAKAGFDMFQQLTEHGDEVILGIRHFNAPLPDGNIIRFEVEREINSEVRRALPCPVYIVVSLVPKADAVDIYHHAGDFQMPLEQLVSHGTFLRKEPAEDKLKEVMTRLKQDIPHSRAHLMPDPSNGLLTGYLRPRNATSELDCRIVQVRYDDGSVALHT